MSEVSFKKYDDLLKYIDDYTANAKNGTQKEIVDAIKDLGMITFSSDKRTILTLSTSEKKPEVEIEVSILCITEIKEFYSAMQYVSAVKISPYGDGKIKMRLTLLDLNAPIKKTLE